MWHESTCLTTLHYQALPEALVWSLWKPSGVGVIRPIFQISSPRPGAVGGWLCWWPCSSCLLAGHLVPLGAPRRTQPFCFLSSPTPRGLFPEGVFPKQWQRVAQPGAPGKAAAAPVALAALGFRFASSPGLNCVIFVRFVTSSHTVIIIDDDYHGCPVSASPNRNQLFTNSAPSKDVLDASDLIGKNLL